ncbi:MAG: ornithine carbamoyltransferase, partial [Trueperaceae bacterium]
MSSTLPLNTVESLTGRDLLSLEDLTRDEFTGLLNLAIDLKVAWKRGERPQPLRHKTLAMIFEKQSLRTRSTFDIAMYQLGGHSVLLSQNYIGWGVRETIRDVAHNLERWVEGIMARTYGHSTLVELARHASVPVVNGLSDLLHPCQLLADYLTMREVFGDLNGVRVAFVGDGNNVCNSHIFAAMQAGTELTIACPDGYDPDSQALERARSRGAMVSIVRDPREAIEGADV